jgi:hypothetical protein
MLSLGVQAANLINKRFSKVVTDAGQPFLLDIFKRMNELTRAGKSFYGLTYDSEYSETHKKTRQGKFQTGYVDLRMSQRRIEYPELSAPSPDYAQIGFQHGGNIFYYHQYGKVKRNNIAVYREIFPKYWINVPQDIKKSLMKRIGNIMNGRNA